MMSSVFAALRGCVGELAAANNRMLRLRRVAWLFILVFTLGGVTGADAQAILSAPQDQTVLENTFVRLDVVPAPGQNLTFQWLKDGVALPGATNAALVLAGPAAPRDRWTFDTDAHDVVGGLDGTLVGGATISNGKLHLSGSGQYMQTGVLDQDVREKTLEAWVRIAAIDGIHRDIISIQTTAGDWLSNSFDAIVLGEAEAGHWRAGSDYSHRTLSFNGPVETASTQEVVHVAAVYTSDHRVAFYRNGKPYGTPYLPTATQGTLRTFGAGTSLVTLGLRNLGTPGSAGAFFGDIEEARLYDHALSAADIARSFASGPDALPDASKRGVTLADTGDYTVEVTAVSGNRTRLAARLQVVPVATPYWNTFASVPGAEWTTKRISLTQQGVRSYLGDFASQTARLTLTNLPPHTAGMLDFDVYVLRTWDGNETGAGPDLFRVGLDDGRTLTRTTFNNHLSILSTSIVAAGQAFPGQAGTDTPPEWFPPLTGSTETATLQLSYSYPNYGLISLDAVYHLSYTFDHQSTNMGFVFTASGLEALANEGWGLDNVRITTVDLPQGLLDFERTYYRVTEKETNAVVNVRRVGGSRGNVGVDLIVNSPAGHTASVTNRLLFAEGETNKTILIPITDNTVVNADETIGLTLAMAGGGAALGPNAAAQLLVLDDDGAFGFSQKQWVVSECNSAVPVQVRWNGATNRLATITFATKAGTALPGSDYSDVSGTLVFNPGESSKTISVPLKDDAVVEPDQTFLFNLGQPSIATLLPPTPQALVIILDNDTPVGAGQGANSAVQALAVQPDGKVLLGGSFSQLNAGARGSIGRINDDGSLDTSFTPGSGANSQVETIAVQPDGKILLGGWFTGYNGASRTRIVRLLPTGLLDSSFSPGNGADNTVYKILVQPDGNILLAGAFTNARSAARGRIARLQASGALDTTFDPGTGANNTIWAMALQPDGKILISGAFSTFNSVARNRLARLNADGALDTGFNVGTGLNSRADAIMVLPDGKILIGGIFTTYNGASSIRVARLNADGSLDTSFSVGTGPNGTVRGLAVEPDGKILVAGEWGTWGGNVQGGIARLNAIGSIDSSFGIGYGANSYATSVGLLPDSRVVFAGDFNLLNGESRARFAILGSNGSQPVQPLQWVQWRAADGGNDHWYALSTRSEPGPNAEQEATGHGGHLASVGSANEQAFLEAAFLHGLNRVRPLWIGFSDELTEGKFVWSSEEPVTYTDWLPGQPSNTNGDEDFTTLNWHFSSNPSDPSLFGRWNDISTAGYSASAGSAVGPYYGIMEVAGAPSAPQPIAGPIVNPSNGHLYYLLGPGTWTDAESAAQALHGHLVTLEDEAENHWVYSTFIAYGGIQRALWIGLTDSASEGTWSWASGNPASYRNWIPGEPNNNPRFGGQNWAMMWPPVVGGIASPYAAEHWNDYWDFQNVVDATLAGLGLQLHGVVEVVPETPDPSNLVFSGVSRAADGSVSLNLPAPLGWRVLLDASQDLIHWETLTNVLATTTPLVFSDPAAATLPARFYRLRYSQQ